MRTLAALLVCVGFVSAASADVLWDQSGVDPAVNALVDQEFGNYPTYASYMVQDVVADTDWQIQSVTTYFTMGTGFWSTAINQGRLSVFPKTGSLPDAGDDPSASSIVDISMNFGANGWEVVADGLAIDLGAGEYWVGLTPIADFGVYGQEFHQAAPIIGEDTAWRNPGGGFGMGTSWTTASILDATWTGTWDAAILVQGIPEPASLALLGLGALALIRRR